MTRAAALVLAEYTDAFDTVGAGPSVSAFRGPVVKGSGFVRAGMMGIGGAYEPPRGPAAMTVPPKGPAAMGYTRVRPDSACADI
jgi:hypothetical protein